jgi:hypothetical protein
MDPDADRRSDTHHVLSALTDAGQGRTGAVAPARRPGALAAPPPVPWTQYRHELAALATAFVALLWLSVGLGLGSGLAALLGCAFGAAALGIWSLEVWGGE